MEVPETNIVERLEFFSDNGNLCKKVHSLGDSHFENIGDIFSFMRHFERFPVISSPMADLAGDVNIRKEVHFDAFHSVSFAVLAAAAFDVEAETSGFVAAKSCFGGEGEEIANIGEDPAVGDGVTARGTTYWGLIDDDGFIEMLEPSDLTDVLWFLVGIIENAEKLGGQNAVDEAAFPGPGNSGYSHS